MGSRRIARIALQFRTVAATVGTAVRLFFAAPHRPREVDLDTLERHRWRSRALVVLLHETSFRVYACRRSMAPIAPPGASIRARCGDSDLED